VRCVWNDGVNRQGDRRRSGVDGANVRPRGDVAKSEVVALKSRCQC